MATQRKAPTAPSKPVMKKPVGGKTNGERPNGTRPAAYRNPELPVAKRVADLLKRMTLEEKVAQMTCVWQKKTEMLVDADGNFDPKKAKTAFRKGYGLGQVGRLSDAGKGLGARAMAELTNTVQKFIIENSRLGIPVVFHEECLHGHAALEGTSFPQPLALGGTFDPELVERLFTMTAAETRLRGGHHALTPVLDVARDPRWGRVEETYGEDPFLVSRMGMAAVRGFQGDATFRNKDRVIATLKHFAAHGQPESGTNCAPANYSERVLREVFLFPFKEAVQKAGAISVMASYNEIDGVPSHANRWLLRDVLRNEWGFKGYIVSDYYAIWELNQKAEVRGNSVAADKKEAALLALRAGVNIELPEPECYLNLVPLVKKGVIKESLLDEMVAPMLFWKFQMGLFEDPYVDPETAERVVGCDEHRQLALQGAREAITLLRNENNLLPLDPAGIRSIAVIGPNANRALLGGYSSTPKQSVTLLEGIKERVGSKVKVLYSEGCKISIGGTWYDDKVEPSDPAEDRKQIAEAVKVAKKADVIVLAIGDSEQTSREAWAFWHLGDRPSLDLVGRQEELVRAMLATGKPVVVMLFAGRPLSINFISENVPAVFQCWFLGQEAGHAAAEALFGDFNPSGKLPITIPRSAGHLPAFYNYKPMARRGYLFDDISPLYPFGYGMSYTTFSIGSPQLSKSKIKPDGRTQVSVEVTNTGSREGTEVVQMYIRDVFSSVTRPVKELKGFQRVQLKPGETRAITFDVTPDLLAFYNIDMKYVVEPGDFEIMVGNSSRDSDLQKVTLQVR
jgi:beta-glucosidase